MNAMVNEVVDDVEAVILEDELRRAVMIEHPLTLRQMTGRFQYVVAYRLSKGRFRELFASFVETFEHRPGLIAGSWRTENDKPSRALAWCGEEGERVMMICDGSAQQDDSVIYLGFTNFTEMPELVCKYWRPIQMKSDVGVNPWGFPVEELVIVETRTPMNEVPATKAKQGFWSRLYNTLFS
jgi:hypothetical protein